MENVVGRTTRAAMTLTPRNAAEYFALQKTTQAAEKVTAIAEALAKQTSEHQRSYEHFYNSLALFSGGTVALSVTYLGYLKTLAKPVVHPKWLVASWIALILCAACSLFWTFFYTHYGHFARTREYMEAQKDKFEAEADEIHNFKNIANLQTSAELAAFIEPRRKAAKVRADDAKYHGHREKLYYHVWQWNGRLARAAFLCGLALLLTFAIGNL